MCDPVIARAAPAATGLDLRRHQRSETPRAGRARASTVAKANPRGTASARARARAGRRKGIQTATVVDLRLSIIL